MAATKFAGSASERASRSRRKAIFLCVLIAVPTVIVAGLYTYLAAIGTRDLEQALSVADLHDKNWRKDALEAARAVVPDAENSMLQIRAARAQLPQPWPHWPVPKGREGDAYARQWRAALDTSFSEMTPAEQLDKMQVEALRPELQRAGKALEIARKLVDMPRGKARINWTTNPISTLLPHVQEARQIADLLAYDAILRAQDNDLAGALNACRAALNAGRAIGDEPFLISQHVRFACRTLALRRVERVLAQGELPAPALRTVQSEFAAEAEEPLLLCGLRGERAFFDEFLEKLQTGEVPPTELDGIFTNRHDGPAAIAQKLGRTWIMLTIKQERAAYLNLETEFVKIASLPTHEQLQRFAEVERTIRGHRILVRLLCPAVTKVATASLRSQAELRCAVTALALERFRIAQGRWPESLDVLLGDYLGEIPTDPFDGQPLRLKRFDKGMVIYSVGADRIDDGGQVLNGPDSRGSDVGFRLWDVKERRQPAKQIRWPDPPAREPEAPGSVNERKR